MKLSNICHHFTFILCSHSYIYIYFSIWLRWDLNVKLMNICFLLKTFTYHPPCIKSSDLVPIYNVFSFPCHILSLKNQKKYFPQTFAFLVFDWHLFRLAFETADRILRNASWCRTCLALPRTSKQLRGQPVAFSTPPTQWLVRWATDKRHDEPLFAGQTKPQTVFLSL